jgi:uncharacterized membrane protein YdcZ (DUF606 family)
MQKPLDNHIGGVTFIVEGITAAAPADYETDLIQLRGGPVTLPLQTAPDKPISDAEMRLLDIKIDCAMRELEAEFPLMAGEVLAGLPGKGLLSEEWEHLAAGTPVVTRTTNFRTIHLASPRLKFENNELIDQREIQVLIAAANPCWGWDLPVQDDGATRFIFDMIDRLLSASQIGLVFTPYLSLFASPPWGVLTSNHAKNTARCAAQQISKENDVALLKGSLSALNNMLNTTYLPYKNKIKGTTGETRIRYMQDTYTWGAGIVTGMTGTLGALSANNLGAAALIAYVTGASAIIGLYQDLSTVDVAVKDPKDSPAITAMRNFAAQAASYVESEVKALIRDRSDAIHVVEEWTDITRCTGSGMSRTCVTIGQRVSGCHWEDAITGTSSKRWKINNNGEIEGQRSICSADMDKYKNPIIDKLQNQLAPLLKASRAFTGATTPPPIP